MSLPVKTGLEITTKGGHSGVGVVGPVVRKRIAAFFHKSELFSLTKSMNGRQTIIIGLLLFCVTASMPSVVDGAGAIGGVSRLWWCDVSI